MGTAPHSNDIKSELDKLDDTISELQEIIDPESNPSNYDAFKVQYDQSVVLQKEIRTAMELLDQKLDSDFEFVQVNLKTLITQANTALTKLLAIAHESEHPRAYEVLSTFINTIASINKDLIALHKTRRDMSDGVEDGKDGQRVNVAQQNNILFTGSSADFLREMQKVVHNK